MKQLTSAVILALLCLYPAMVIGHSELQWGEEGYPLCTEPGNQYSTDAAPDGDAGAIIVWVDERAGMADIYAQRIDEDAYIQWDSAGIAVCLLSDEKRTPRVVPDDSMGPHGGYIVWINEPSGSTTLKAQRLLMDGFRDWGSGGTQISGIIEVDSAGVDVAPSQSFGTIDGLLAVWSDISQSGTLYAQLVEPDGSTPWGADGIEVAPSGTWQSYPSVVSDDQGGLVAVWDESGIIKAQRIGIAGYDVWGSLGIEVAPSAYTQARPRVTRTSDGDFVFTWTELLPGGARVRATKLDDLGGTQWGPVNLPSSGGEHDMSEVVADDAGGVTVGYTETAADDDLYAVGLDFGGTVSWHELVATNVLTGDRSLKLERNPGDGTYFAWARDDGGDTKMVVQYLDNSGDYGLLSGGLDLGGLISNQDDLSFTQIAPCLMITSLSGNILAGRDIVLQKVECKSNLEVQYNRAVGVADSTAILGIIASSGGFVQHVAKYVNSVFIGKTKASLKTNLLGLGGVTAVVPQYPMKLWLDVSTRAMKARKSSTYSPNTSEDKGYDGTGVNVCIIDTGVDDLHWSLDDFDDNTGTVDPKFVWGYDAVTRLGGNTDDDCAPVYHGTHCAGIAVGTGGGSQCGSPPGSLYAGVAPGAGLLEVKVFPRSGTLTGGTTAMIVRGMEWVLDHHSDRNIDVASMSLGFARICNGTKFYNKSDSTWYDCSVCPLANAMVDSGVVTVIAAGNSGPDNKRNKTGLGCPGTADKVIMVAAMHDSNTVSRSDDIISYYSSRGPRSTDNDGDSTDENKPEVAAIGGVGASLIKGTKAVYSCRGVTPGQAAGCLFWGISGTSMACPHVAGVCALMLDANSNLSPAQVKNILINTADDWGTAGWDTSYGWGFVDAYEACEEARKMGGDGEVCFWPRQDWWWNGVHLAKKYLGIQLVTGVTMYNLGPGMATGYDAHFYYSDPTSACCVPGPNDTFGEMVGLPSVAEFDSVVIESVFISVPGANSFGQDFWTVKVRLESDYDPGSSKWPVEENNVAVHSLWKIDQSEWEPGNIEDFYFWAENPEDDAGFVTLDVVDSILPVGFTVTLDPPEGTPIMLDPLDRTQVRLTPSLVDSGDAVLVVVEAYLESGGYPAFNCGGITIEYGSGDDAAVSGTTSLNLALSVVPTPFAREATIFYTLPADAEVNISIYDVQGRLARGIPQDLRPAGRHAANWDGRNDSGSLCSPGIYFVELRAGDRVRRTSTVLLR